MKTMLSFLLFLMICTLPITFSAQERIDKNQAVTVSNNFFGNIGINVVQVTDIETDYLNDTLCLYCIHHSDGRWTIVSASERAFPVLAYGKNPNMSLLNNDNPGFNSLIWSYKRSILDADNAQTRSFVPSDSVVQNDIARQWNSLLHNSKGPNSIVVNYNYGVELLNIPGRGKVEWGQSKNNDGECDPSYNMYCMYNPYMIEGCTCDRPPTGCAPVAMGQVMWYWQWPLNSPEDNQLYKWEIMPPELGNATEPESADNIARLLKDLGHNMNAAYSCFGTAVLPAVVEEGFTNFGYRAVDRRKRSDWGYEYSWTELVRTEIDNNRPVVIYGEDGWIVNGHYYVVDGYDSFNNNLFHINWGWNGGGYVSNNNSEYYHLYASDYSVRMSAFVGISPSYSSSEILQHYHDSNGVSSYLYALGDLDLPDGYVSSVIQGDTMIINAGRTVSLLPGFEAVAGCNLSVEIDPFLQSTFGIAILEFPGYNSIPFEGAIMKAANANSFECSVYEEGDNHPVYQHSGSVRDNVALVWDGTNYSDGVNYTIDVTFRNNFGMKNHIVFHIGPEGTAPLPEQTSTESINVCVDRASRLQPNPASGSVRVESSYRIAEVELFSLDGRSLQRRAVDATGTTLNISQLPSGTYIVRIATTSGTAYKKLVVK